MTKSIRYILKKVDHLKTPDNPDGNPFLPGNLTIDEALKEIEAIIRTEKLKLLDRISSHQEDLFWWTGGEYEKTKAVDMRAIASEREQLTKLEAEL